MSKETQESITAWGLEAFPNQTLKSNYLHVIEEVVELGVALGIDKQDILNVVSGSYTKSANDFNDQSKVSGEIADAYISVAGLASSLNINISEAVDEKMIVNRSRSNDEYKTRLALKKKFF